MSVNSFDQTLGARAAQRFAQPARDARGRYVDNPYTPEHRARRERFAMAWNYYLGHQARPLNVEPGSQDFNIILNVTRQIVDDSTAFLFGREVSYMIDDDPRQTEEERIVEEFWQPRQDWNPGEFYLELGQAGAVTGTPFVRIYPREGGEHRLMVIDSGAVDVITAAGDARYVVAYHIIWPEQNSYKRDRIERGEGDATWTIYQDDWIGSKKQWQENPAATELWPYDFAPVFHCQNLPLAHSFWGVSDIDGGEINDALNRVASNTNKTLNYFAWPWVVLSGASADDLRRNIIDVGPDKMLTLPPEAMAKTLEMQSDLGSSDRFMERIKQAYLETAGSVRLDPVQVSVGSLSGFAVQLLYLPLLQKTEKKRRSYGAMLSQINYALLRLAGLREPSYVQAVFEEPLPQNELERAQLAIQLATMYDAGGAARVAGYSRDDIDALTERMIVEHLNGPGRRPPAAQAARPAAQAPAADQDNAGGN